MRPPTFVILFRAWVVMLRKVSRLLYFLFPTQNLSKIFLRTSSWVVRRPAVSMKRKRWPPMVIVSSTVSRVVPAMSETMARSSPVRAFRRVLLPALTAPTMATGTPLRRALP